MATLFYSMAGEGRGHAVRARVIVERLRNRHRIVLYASRDAYHFLAPKYAKDGDNVVVREIPGLHFKYSESGCLDLTHTAVGGVRFLSGLGGIVDSIAADIQRDKPTLAITDFEPALPRAAQRSGLPFISLNHQHFLVVSDLTGLPAWLQRHAFFMSVVVRGFYWGQRATVVSSFHNPPARKAWCGAKQIGVLLREDVRSAKPEARGHVMAYFRKFASSRILVALKNCGRPVRILGLGERPRDGNLEFLESAEPAFLETLTTCDALVTTAGNQLVGEALYLGKPVFALPESGNYEQYINAHCLKQSGGGVWAEMDRVGPNDVQRFIDALPDIRTRIQRESVDGTAQAVRIIEEQLKHAESYTLSACAEFRDPVPLSN